MASNGVKSWSTTAASNIIANIGVATAGSNAVSTFDNSLRQLLADLRAEFNVRSGAIASGGSSNAYTYTTTSAGYGTAWSAYAHGDFIVFEANHTNTGAATLNVDTIGAKTIKKLHDQDVVAGDIEAGGVYAVMYDSGDDVFQLLSSVAVAPQVQGDVLDDLNTLGAASSDGEVIVATGAGAFAYESGATLRTSVGVGTGDSPQFTAVNVGHATDTTIARVSAGVISVEGDTVPTLGAANTFTANQKIGNTQPRFYLNETDATADEGLWMLYASGDTLLGATRDDADSGGANWLVVSRTGTTVDGVQFPAPITATGNVLPTSDNTYDIGASGQRWDDIWATNGTIQTSDAREKTPLEPIPEGVLRAVRNIIGGIGVYQWLSSVDNKGKDGARRHIGVTAQAVRDAFAAEGEDPERWALFCANEITETVEVPRTVPRRRPVMEEVPVDEVSAENGVAVLRTVIKQRPVFDELPVVDENGDPVEDEIPAIEMIPVLDDGGAPVLDDNGDPLTTRVHGVRRVQRAMQVQRFETFTDTVLKSETRPKLDENGKPLVRYGVRYEQLAMLAIAALAQQ